MYQDCFISHRYFDHFMTTYFTFISMLIIWSDAWYVDLITICRNRLYNIKVSSVYAFCKFILSRKEVTTKVQFDFVHVLNKLSIDLAWSKIIRYGLVYSNLSSLQVFKSFFLIKILYHLLLYFFFYKFL